MASTKVFDLKIRADELTEVFADMNIALKRSVVNSLNTTGRKANREIAIDIKTNYNIKARSLKLGNTVKLIRADGRKAVPIFTIRIIRKPRGLFLYSAKKGKGGVSVRIKKTRKVVKGSYFVNSRRFGKTFVAKRHRKGGKIDRISASGKRYKAHRSEWPVGPSIAQLYSRRKSRRILKGVLKGYKAELDSQFNKQFERRR